MRASPWFLKVDPGSGKVVGQIEAPGAHSNRYHPGRGIIRQRLLWWFESQRLLLVSPQPLTVRE